MLGIDRLTVDPFFLVGALYGPPARSFFLRGFFARFLWPNGDSLGRCYPDDGSIVGNGCVGADVFGELEI